MDKDRELASKVDALMARHAAAREGVEDRNVPVLTEVINAPSWAPAPVDTSAALSRLSEAEVEALSQEIFGRVYGKLDRELADRLEDRISTQLASQITIAIANVVNDMRQEIANEIGDAVNAALADKLRKK